jgi:4a-hydroxytetrahydrobiopterin dehydratase
MAFVNKIAEVAEAEGHHPDLTISYNNLSVELTTHAINGLSENDFILAAKIDQI